MKDKQQSTLEMLEAMQPDERKIFLQEECLRSEEQTLKYLVDSHKHHREMIDYLENKAREGDGDEEYDLDSDEWREIAKDLRGLQKGILGDIREQRKRVQWERRKLKQMQTKLKNTEQEKPSEPSET